MHDDGTDYLWCEDQLRRPCDGVLALQAEIERLRAELLRLRDLVGEIDIALIDAALEENAAPGEGT